MIADRGSEQVVGRVPRPGGKAHQRLHGGGVVGAGQETVLGGELDVAEPVAKTGTEGNPVVSEPDGAVDDRRLEQGAAHHVRRQEKRGIEAGDAERGHVAPDAGDRAVDAATRAGRVERHEGRADLRHAVHGAVQGVAHGMPVRQAVTCRARGRAGAVQPGIDVLLEARQRRVELREESEVGRVRAGDIEAGVEPEIGARVGQLQGAARRHPHDRHRQAHREAARDAELGGDGVGAALLAHAQEAGPEARHEAREQRLSVGGAQHLRPNDGDQVPGHGPHVLLELGQGGDVATAHGVARETEAEPASPCIGELVVPGHDARIERHAQDAAARDVGALDGLGGKASPAGDGGAHERENEAKAAH